MVQLGVDEGSDYQEIHRDFRPLFSDQVVPLYALSVNFPLVEVAENGPFQMARGTRLAA